MRIYTLIRFFPIVVALSCSKPPVAQHSFSQHRTTHERIGEKYAIASPAPHTGHAAKTVLDQGGNIVDAAIAASFAVSVERPQSTGLGGGGFMLLKLKSLPQILAIDFREQAPLKATETMYLDKQGNVVPKLSIDGIRAAAIPGLVAGLVEIHEKYGKLPLEKVMEPAILLARNGFEVYPHLAEALKERQSILAGFPASKAVFLKADGSTYKVGDILKQHDLANTLEEISRHGKNGFYQGWVAKALIKQQKTLGGLITEEDLKQYNVEYRAPVKGRYKDYDIYSMPPPSSGGVHIIQILNILEDRLPSNIHPLSVKAVHLTSSAMMLAFRDRAKYLGDPSFVNIPVRGLTSETYADFLSNIIPEKKALVSAHLTPVDPFKHESDQTTHISIMDSEGNIVSTTQTVNGYMGSGVVVPSAGFLLNNEMDDFSVKPGVPNMFGAIGGKENAIAPKKRPLSSMSPVIVMKDGMPALTLGSPGGTRIISCVLLTMLNYLHYRMPLYESVAAFRYHHQWAPDEIRLEGSGLPERVIDELTGYGYKINRTPYKCQVQAVANENGKLHAVADPRDVGSVMTED